MPKHVIEFNLPEEQDELAWALNGSKYLAVLTEFAEWLRRKYKHSNPPSLEAANELAEIQASLQQILNDNEVDL